MNFIMDVLVQPATHACIETLLWIALFSATTSQTIGGFSKEHYLSYVLWAAFIARINTSWMFEFRMVDEVDSGAVNSILARPVSFFEYYLSQFLGYKLITTAISLLIPLGIHFVWGSPILLERLPAVLLLVFYYLFLVHMMSFCICAMAFFFNRVHSFTVAKNLTLWIISGELFPLDLVPEPWKSVLLNLPFSSAVYVPVAYLTGRIGFDSYVHGFYTITGGIIVFGIVGSLLWKAGLRQYSGTGA